MDNRCNGSNTEGGWTIDGMAAIRKEDGQSLLLIEPRVCVCKI